MHLKKSQNMILPIIITSVVSAVASTAQAQTTTDPHGNVGYDTAAACDAAVQAGTAKFYKSFTFKPPLKRAGETSVKKTTLAEADPRYALGACDIGVGRKLGRDGVGKELIGKYVPYSPKMMVNAYSDKNGQLKRLSMQQCDNWFSDSLPRPVPAIVKAVAAPKPAPAPAPIAPPVVAAPVTPKPIYVPPTPVAPPAPVVAPTIPAFVPSVPAAKGMSPYLFGGIGAMRDTGQLTPTSSTFKKTAGAGQLGLGLQFNSLLGAELFYQAAKEYEPALNTNAKISDLGARLTLGGELSPGWRAFAKLGAERVRHELNNVTTNQTRPTVGLGLTTEMTRDLKLRFDFDHTPARGTNTPQWKASNYLGFGLQYNF